MLAFGVGLVSWQALNDELAYFFEKLPMAVSIKVERVQSGGL